MHRAEADPDAKQKRRERRMRRVARCSANLPNRSRPISSPLAAVGDGLRAAYDAARSDRDATHAASRR